MASDIIIQVKCEPYMIKFLETLYGPSPISFPKKSNFNALLDAAAYEAFIAEES